MVKQLGSRSSKIFGRGQIARFLSVFAFFIGGAPCSAIADDDDVSVSIDQILTSVQSALSDAQVVLYNNKMPPLKGVKLELQAVFSQSASAGLNLYIISSNGKITSDTTQKLVLSLSPPPPEQTAPAAAPKVIAQSLRDGIIQAARGVQAAATRKPPLQIRELSAELEFVVQKEGGGEVGVKFSIVPVDAKLGATVSSGTIQRITIDFGY